VNHYRQPRLQLAICSQASGKLFSRDVTPHLDTLKVKTGSLGGYCSDALRLRDDRLIVYVRNVGSGATTEGYSRIDDGDDLCRFDRIFLRQQLSAANRLRLA
jgi:hypothetical protein